MTETISASSPFAFITLVTRFRDSNAITLITTRTRGFFSKRISRISSSCAVPPPINAWVGTGSVSSASGTLPRTSVSVSAPNFSRFFKISSWAPAFFSMAYTWPCRAIRAASTATEPVPAPMSKSTDFSESSSFERATALTSLLVMGTSPRINRSSLMPGPSCQTQTAPPAGRTPAPPAPSQRPL